MKHLIAIMIFLSAATTTKAQTYADYFNAANDSAFLDKVKYALYVGAKQNVANTTVSATVKRFSQVVITEVTQPRPSWLVPFSFVLLTVPELGVVTTASNQTTVNTVALAAYTTFAKAWYKDTSN